MMLMIGALVTTRVITSQNPCSEDSEGPLFCLAKEGDGESVDSGAKERKGGRQQGEGGRQSNQYHQYGSNGKGLEEGEGNNEEAAEGYYYGEAAE